MSKKHKRHKLSSAWSPYGPDYVPKWKPVPSHIDVQGGEKPKPIKPVEVERALMTTGADVEDWGLIE